MGEPSVCWRWFLKGRPVWGMAAAARAQIMCILLPTPRPQIVLKPGRAVTHGVGDAVMETWRPGQGVECACRVASGPPGGSTRCALLKSEQSRRVASRWLARAGFANSEGSRPGMLRRPRGRPKMALLGGGWVFWGRCREQGCRARRRRLPTCRRQAWDGAWMSDGGWGTRDARVCSCWS
jgi:hypothetical protein